MLAASAPSCQLRLPLPVGDQVVERPLRVSPKEDFTTPKAVAIHSSLTQQTMTSMRSEFDGVGHFPSTTQYEAIEALVSTFEAMADGTCQRNFYLSSLDPGVGKTSAVKHFVRHLLGSSHHQDVSVLVCLTRKAEIKRLIEDMGLLPSQFAVLTSDKAVNALSPTPEQEARVLFTTHQMVNAASAALNKWMREHAPDGCSMHSFRHSMRDRLRAVECPADIVDQVGGWQTDGVGHGYGSGYPMEVLRKWMKVVTWGDMVYGSQQQLKDRVKPIG